MKLKDLARGWTLSPTARISMGLVSLLVGLLMVLDLVLKLLPDQRVMTQALREQVAVHLALQVKVMLGDAQTTAAVAPLLRDVVQHSKDMRTLGLRREDGVLLAATEGHDARWEAPSLGLSTLNSVVVPLNGSNGKWGQLEVG